MSPAERSSAGGNVGVVILVVEDEAVVAIVLEFALGLAGHEVLGPVGGEGEALRLAAERRPELALVDIRLSRGGSAVRLARALKERWAVPSLFLSGQTGQARAAGDVALGLIGKPYDPGEVVDAVAAVGELLAGRRPALMPRRLELLPGWWGWESRAGR